MFKSLSFKLCKECLQIAVAVVSFTEGVATPSDRTALDAVPFFCNLVDVNKVASVG